MNFDEVKKIWDENSHSNKFVIDENVLHERVFRSNEQLKRMMGIFEIVMFLIIFLTAGIFIIEGILDQEYYQIPGGSILLIAAGYILWNRKERKKIQAYSDRTIRDEIRQSLRLIDFQIARHRNFVWWFILPFVLSGGIQMAFTYDGKPWWIWVVTAGSFILGYWITSREVEIKHKPKRQELLDLKKLLIEED